MTVLIVLVVAWLFFRLLGVFGIPVFLTWHDSLAYGLAVMFLFTSIAHFNRLRLDLARMIPPLFPAPRAIVTITGLLEIVGAIGLMIPQFRHQAASALLALLIVMFLANIHAARVGGMLGGKRVTPLWLRAPMQLLFVALLWWTARP
ncbi:MAG: DoxX family protein [Acidobacteriota bacterium]